MANQQPDEQGTSEGALAQYGAARGCPLEMEAFLVNPELLAMMRQSGAQGEPRVEFYEDR